MNYKYNFMPAKVFTTTIDPSLFEWLTQAARKGGTTKRNLLETAIIQLKQKEFSQGFKKIAGDAELITLAESGLDDLQQQLKALDL